MVFLDLAFLRVGNSADPQRTHRAVPSLSRLCSRACLVLYFYGLGYQPVLPWLSAAAGSIVIEFGSKSGSFDPRCPTKGWGLPHLPVDLLFADDEAQTTRLRIEEYRVSKRGLTVHEFIPITYHKGIGIWRSAARA